MCDGRASLLMCFGTVMQIFNATYGMADPHVCPASSRSSVQQPCTTDVTKFVQFKCEGQSYCTMLADAGSFGDPCPRGTRKYLEINYKCQPKGKIFFISFLHFGQLTPKGESTTRKERGYCLHLGQDFPDF